MWEIVSHIMQSGNYFFLSNIMGIDSSKGEATLISFICLFLRYFLCYLKKLCIIFGYFIIFLFITYFFYKNNLIYSYFNILIMLIDPYYVPLISFKYFYIFYGPYMFSIGFMKIFLLVLILIFFSLIVFYYILNAYEL